MSSRSNSIQKFEFYTLDVPLPRGMKHVVRWYDPVLSRKDNGNSDHDSRHQPLYVQPISSKYWNLRVTTPAQVNIRGGSNTKFESD